MGNGQTINTVAYFFSMLSTSKISFNIIHRPMLVKHFHIKQQYRQISIKLFFEGDAVTLIVKQ